MRSRDSLNLHGFCPAPSQYHSLARPIAVVQQMDGAQQGDSAIELYARLQEDSASLFRGAAGPDALRDLFKRYALKLHPGEDINARQRVLWSTPWHGRPPGATMPCLLQTNPPLSSELQPAGRSSCLRMLTRTHRSSIDSAVQGTRCELAQPQFICSYHRLCYDLRRAAPRYS